MKAGPRSAGEEVLWLVAAVVMGMAPWFSATVVARAMVGEWLVAPSMALVLTLGVQLGFVLGSLVSASFLLADRLRAQRLAAVCATIAAAATASPALFDVGFESAVFFRVVVGFSLAGVYPPGIKLAAGWTRERRGLAIGTLVAGTTVGSAVPHLLVGATTDWRSVQLLAAAAALSGAALFAFRVRSGPWERPASQFHLRAARDVLRNRGVRLATGGYLGHMWELYAMWSSIGALWAAVGAARGLSPRVSSLGAFASIAAGAVGCVTAGAAADRIGRTRVANAAMLVSGVCCLVVGFVLDGPLWVFVLVCLLWGCSVVADSAQFSAAVTEAAAAEYVGTAVTIQTASGFLLTAVTIGLVPVLVEVWGWRYAYAPLALGPAVGVICMWRYGASQGGTASGRALRT